MSTGQSLNLTPDGGGPGFTPFLPIFAGASLPMARIGPDAIAKRPPKALGLALRGMIAEGRRPLPPPREEETGLVEIAVDPATALKLAVIEAFAASGLSKIRTGAAAG